MPVPGDLVGGRFRLIEQLGRGGMGRVFRAHDELLDRYVAIKIMYDEAVRDRERRRACAVEALAAARLAHPGIARIFDGGFFGDQCFVVMELVEGETLTTIIRAHGRLPTEQALQLAIQLADALDAAHREGVVHCDVKPGNIIVDGAGRPRLVDFGIAHASTMTTSLHDGTLYGSAEYVAPEQVRDERVDGRTDVYALGIILYEMLSGRTPFGGGSLASVVARRLAVDAPPLYRVAPEVPPSLARIVAKALAREPKQRFQTAAELRDALQAIQSEIETLRSLGLEGRQVRLGYRPPGIDRLRDWARQGAGTAREGHRAARRLGGAARQQLRRAARGMVALGLAAANGLDSLERRLRALQPRLRALRGRARAKVDFAIACAWVLLLLIGSGLAGGWRRSAPARHRVRAATAGAVAVARPRVVQTGAALWLAAVQARGAAGAGLGRACAAARPHLVQARAETQARLGRAYHAAGPRAARLGQLLIAGAGRGRLRARRGLSRTAALYRTASQRALGWARGRLDRHGLRPAALALAGLMALIAYSGLFLALRSHQPGASDGAAVERSTAAQADASGLPSTGALINTDPTDGEGRLAILGPRGAVEPVVRPEPVEAHR